MKRTDYWKKLQDPRWQRLRLEVMQRDSFTCRECGDKETTLNVHHKFYKKGADPWDYRLHDLVTLCEDCHSQIEPLRRIVLSEITTVSEYRRAGRLVAASFGEWPFFGPNVRDLMTAVFGVLDAVECCAFVEAECPKDAQSKLQTAMDTIKATLEIVNAESSGNAIAAAEEFRQSIASQQ